MRTIHEPRYMRLADVLRLEREADDRGVSKVARSPRGFLTAFKVAKGNPKNLDAYWRNRRRGFIARHLAQAELRGEPWREKGGRRTRRALALIMWAYDPEGIRPTLSALR